jgi:3-oxoacyl-[acyl-carrier protein] reductase
MDLGIAGRKAIVCASSRGLGKACARALAEAGCEVVMNGRNAPTLDAATAEIAKATGAKVTSIAADVATLEGQRALLAACPAPDILINNNAGPPLRDFRELTRQQMIDGVIANMIVAVELIQKVIDPMSQRKFGRIVNITSAMVKSPRPHMGLSTAARAALTAFAKSQSFEVMADNVTINNMLPERIKTGRQEFMAKRMVQADGITMDEAYKRIAATLAAKRMGTAEEFGDACAYLCSAQAGFISGQNLQLDGGSYAGLI